METKDGIRRIVVRVTPEEKKAIKIAAATAGMTMEDYIKEAIRRRQADE
jgi:predicted DNA binding CopG/RHH family protein